MATDFSNKCKILAELWMDYRHDTEFEDFIDYNDLGLPLAFFIDEGIVKTSPKAEIYINETFELFVLALEADPEENYESLEDLLMKYGS